MNKIKILSITGLRGIKENLVLNLNQKSILFYGDNGSGKSSITDALEWFYYDRIEHLVSEETGATKGKGALRNLFLLPTDDAFIKLEFNKPEYTSQKTINNALRISQTNTSEDLKELLAKSQSENLILRYKDLVTFIIARKKQKLDELQRIIGFNEVGNVRDLLKRNAVRIARNIKSNNYENKKSIQQSVLLENFGQNITSAKQFFEVANNLIKPLKLKIEIKNYQDINEVLKEIESKEDTETVNKINLYNRINENLSEVVGNIDNINSEYSDYYNTVLELKKEKEKIEKLQLLDLLIEGQKLLKSEIIKDDVCPLCQQDKNKNELILELNKRIEELEELSKEKLSVEQKSKDLQQTIQVNINTLNSLKSEKLLNTKDFEIENKQVENLINSLGKYTSELKKNFITENEIGKPDDLIINKSGVEIIVNSSKTKLKDLLEAQKKNPKLQIHTKLSLAKQAYGQYNQIIKEEAVLRKQQHTFHALFADFIKRQEEAINVFLEMFSKEINDYYTSMNPNERVENISLVPLKDNNDDLVGITIKYDFFNETKSPPIAYLSESHINCLGLSFYLASVKAFNKENKFFILDDIVSSFDRPHRTRFARLLTSKFNDYQIILLTHEREFYELISSEVKSKGWLLQDLHWNSANGTVLKTPLIDYKSQIEEKFTNRDTNDLGNLIRKYLERQLKIIANELEAKVAFRFNAINEKRMASELLDSVQGKLKASSELKALAEIPKIQRIPMLLGNTTSHDNEFQESIEDLEVMWEDIKKLIHCFFCTDCNKFISVKYYDSVEKKIRCGCGKLKYDWKM